MRASRVSQTGIVGRILKGFGSLPDLWRERMRPILGRISMYGDFNEQFVNSSGRESSLGRCTLSILLPLLRESQRRHRVRLGRVSVAVPSALPPRAPLSFVV